MDGPPLLTSRDLIFLNDHFISGYGGGVSGVRCPDGLENAASQSFITLFGEEQYASSEAKAAALFESIIRIHPFSDGNKRTAFLAGITLYEILSGVEPVVEANEAVRVCSASRTAA